MLMINPSTHVHTYDPIELWQFWAHRSVPSRHSLTSDKSNTMAKVYNIDPFKPYYIPLQVRPSLVRA